MPSRAVLVPALLCFIMQVELTPCVLGSDGQSHGSSSYNKEQTLQKRSISIRGTSDPSSVPELVNLTLQATLHEITASWALKDTINFPGVMFGVTTEEFDEIVYKNSIKISGLASNTRYDVIVSVYNSSGAPYGVSSNATIVTNGVPELVNLTLQATLHEITASWALKDTINFPGVIFRVTTAGVDELVYKNSFKISGLASNTRYDVIVSVYNSSGAPYRVSSNATIVTNGVPELFNLTLQKKADKLITATWSLKDKECFPDVKYRITTTGVDKIVSQNSYNISGFACNSTYYVKVSPVDASGAPNGVSSNATVTNKVPELFNLTLQEVNKLVTATWSLKDKECFPNVKYIITTTGVYRVASQNSFNISGLACNTTYTIKVSPIAASGAPTGGSTNATVLVKGVPEVANLLLRATLHEITASWVLKDKNCVSGMRFRVTTTGVNQLVSQNSHTISGLTCNTNYYVNVSPVGADGTPYGISSNVSIATKKLPELFGLTIQETLNVVTVRWSLNDSDCFPSWRFRVSTLGVNTIVSEKSYNIIGLACNTTYTIKVSPVDGSGATKGVSTDAKFLMKGVPELANLALRATLYGITASWSLKKPKCFPAVRYRVITTGVDKIVTQNSYNFSGLACNTRYHVKVSPVNESGVTYGVPANASIITIEGGPELVNLTLQETNKMIMARWSMKIPECFPGMRFRVTTAGVNQIVSTNSYNISGVACNTQYYVKVSAIDASGANYGVQTNALILVKGVPEMNSVQIQARLNVISGNWTLKEPKCFRNIRYRVSIAGVHTIVPQNVFSISGFACNTSYNVTISPIDAAGATYGGYSATATVLTQGVPEVIDLYLIEIRNGITARWAQKDPKCAPNVRYLVTHAGVDKIVSEKFFNISGIVCDTSYTVKVSPVNAANVPYGVSASATINSDGGVKMSMIAMVAESLVVKWSPVNSICRNFSGYEVSLSLLDGTNQRKNITQKMYLVFAGLNATTVYKSRVQLLGSSGQLIGRGVSTLQMTINGTSPSGRCPFPSLGVVTWSTFVMCAWVEVPTESTNLQANDVCSANHPPSLQVPYYANLYFAAPGWPRLEAVQEYLRVFDYTEEYVVNGFHRNGSWVWGFGVKFEKTFKIDPALLVGLPAGGDGPNDYKMLYMDPAKDFRLSVAKDGYSFGGMICVFPLKL